MKASFFWTKIIWLHFCFIGGDISAQHIKLTMNNCDSLLFRGVCSNKISIHSGFVNISSDNGIIKRGRNWFCVEPKTIGICRIFFSADKWVDTIVLSVLDMPDPDIFVVPHGENGGRGIKFGTGLMALGENCMSKFSYEILSFKVRFTKKDGSILELENLGSSFNNKITTLFRQHLEEFTKIDFVDIKLLLPDKKRSILKIIIHANMTDSPW